MSENASQTDILKQETMAEPEFDFSEYYNGEGKQTPPQENEQHIIKYNGKELEMSLEELKTAAQKGLNYDKVKAQRDALAGEAEDDDLTSFLDEYPDMDPESIPQEVYEKAEQEGGLLPAYRSHLLKAQTLEIEHLKRENENLKKSPGGVSSESDSSYDPFLAGLFGN